MATGRYVFSLLRVSLIFCINVCGQQYFVTDYLSSTKKLTNKLKSRPKVKSEKRNLKTLALNF